MPAVTLPFAAITVFLVSLAVRSFRYKVTTGAEGMIGKVVEVRRWSGREGVVSVSGELWQARSRTPLAAGDEATVVAVSNLTLQVEPVASTSPELQRPKSR